MVMMPLPWTRTWTIRLLSALIISHTFLHISIRRRPNRITQTPLSPLLSEITFDARPLALSASTIYLNKNEQVSFGSVERVGGTGMTLREEPVGFGTTAPRCPYVQKFRLILLQLMLFSSSGCPWFFFVS